MRLTSIYIPIDDVASFEAEEKYHDLMIDGLPECDLEEITPRHYGEGYNYHIGWASPTEIEEGVLSFIERLPWVDGELTLGEA